MATDVIENDTFDQSTLQAGEPKQWLEWDVESKNNLPRRHCQMKATSETDNGI